MSKIECSFVFFVSFCDWTLESIRRNTRTIQGTRNVCGGVEADVPYFFEESEPHSSLIGCLFFKLSFLPKRKFFSVS